MTKSRIQVYSALVLVTPLLLSACCVSPPSQPESPISPPSPLSTIVPFQLEKPITEGATLVKGTGVPGVPIIIANISFMGRPLGTGTINPDGTFEVKVPALEKNLLIGLQVGDLTGTRWKQEDFYAPEYRGDQAMQVPQVGFFHDTTTVIEK
jgi:hypothetical protein